MKACREFRAALRALLEGELELERTLELEEHAHGCPGCGAELERARALERALLALPPAPIERLDLRRNVQAVLARIEAQAPPVRARLRILRYAPSAAAAALAALLGWRFLVPAPMAPQVAPPALATEEQPGLDTTRLESARAEVCAALRECRPEFDPARDDARAFAEEVDERTDGLARSGWPRPSLVRTAAADADPALAARALRWLGTHGESASFLRAALAQGALAPGAVAALIDLGPAGVDELRRVPESAALRALMLQQLERFPRPALAPWIEETLARGRASPEDRAQLLAALADEPEQAVPALLRLASSGALEESEALARLALVPGAELALSRVLEDVRGSGIDEHLLLLAVAEVGAADGWDWVERQAREGRHERDALLALARGTPEALAALLRLRAGSGADAAELERTLELVLRERPDSAAILAVRAPRAEIAQLFELLGSAPEPALVPALVELAGREALPEPDRRWALLLAAEQGRPEDLARLVALFARLRERTLQAACLIALQALGGSGPVDEALGRRSTAVRRRVHALLDDPANTNRNATTLARLARAIESSLPAPQP